MTANHPNLAVSGGKSRKSSSLALRPRTPYLLPQRGYDVMVACQLPKLNARVRFPLPAPTPNGSQSGAFFITATASQTVTPDVIRGPWQKWTGSSRDGLRRTGRWIPAQGRDDGGVERAGSELDLRRIGFPGTGHAPNCHPGRDPGSMAAAGVVSARKPPVRTAQWLPGHARDDGGVERAGPEIDRKRAGVPGSGPILHLSPRP